jgi:hypothetical protein
MLRLNFEGLSGSDVEIAERILVHAEKVGAITIDRNRKFKHVLQRIRLEDNDKLAALLGRKVAATKAVAVLDAVAPLLANAPAWIQDAIEVGLQRWNRGDRHLKIDAEDIPRILDFTKLLLAIDRGVDGRDLRTFSIEAGVDSKAFERNRGSIISIIREAYGLEGLEAAEVLAAIGFRPFHQPVHLRGPVAVEEIGIDASRARPYIAIPPACGQLIRLTGKIENILTVENFASFNRHANEIADPACLVVYCGGFPSPPVVQTLKAAISQAPNARLFHWGDIDVGGIRIFCNLEERLGRRITPHLMTIELAVSNGKLKEPVPGLARIAGSDSGIANVAGYLADGEPRHLEQEAVSPAPLS